MNEVRSKAHKQGWTAEVPVATGLQIIAIQRMGNRGQGGQVRVQWPGGLVGRAKKGGGKKKQKQKTKSAYKNLKTKSEPKAKQLILVLTKLNWVKKLRYKTSLKKNSKQTNKMVK